MKRSVAKRSRLSPTKKLWRYAAPCTCAIATYHGIPTSSAAPIASASGPGASADHRRSITTSAASTSPGSAMPTGPFVRNAAPAAAPASAISHGRGRSGTSAASMPTTIASEMNSASGRSGNASRAITAGPRLVAATSPATRPVVSPNQRRPQTHANSASAMPDSAAGSLAAASVTPSAAYDAVTAPVVENGLLEPVGVVEPRREQIAALAHLAAGLGVERFVGIGDRGTAKTCRAGERGRNEHDEDGVAHDESACRDRLTPRRRARSPRSGASATGDTAENGDRSRSSRSE